MRNARPWVLALAAITIAAPAPPAEAPTPLPGSAGRAAILDALRPAVEAKLGPRIEFVVTTVRSAEGWAFVVADPQRRGGAPVDGAALFGEDWENMDGLRVDAVLRRRPRGWTVVEFTVGATDAWYCGGREVARRKVVGC